GAAVSGQVERFAVDRVLVPVHPGDQHVALRTHAVTHGAAFLQDLRVLARTDAQHAAVLGERGAIGVVVDRALEAALGDRPLLFDWPSNDAACELTDLHLDGAAGAGAVRQPA